MSAWVFDLGNTRLKFAPVSENGGIGEVVGMAHDGTAFADDWQARLPDRIDTAFVASVAPVALRVALLDALARRCGRVSLACTLPSFAGLRIAYAQPRRLGVDRFLAMLGALGHGRQTWLVVGVGTALTVDLVDADGRHHGGRIAPSPALMREALHRRAAQLPESGGVFRAFADDTEDALASGCIGAALGLIETSLAAATASTGQRPALLLHGGGADMMLPHLPGARHAPALVLEGLSAWARPRRSPLLSSVGDAACSQEP